MSKHDRQGTSVGSRWSRGTARLALASLVLLVPACELTELFSWNGGKPTLFGYATAPNYDRRFKTVRLKIFKNSTPWAVVPVPGLEMQLTQALAREIEQTTPYKVVQGDADTEITGIVRGFTKLNLNYNQTNEVRESETTLTVEVLWRDLRTGEVLSAPSQRSLEPLPPAGLLPGQQDPLASASAAPTTSGAGQPPVLTAPNSPLGQPATMANTAQPATPGGVPLQPGGPMIPGIPVVPGAPGTPPGAPAPGVLVRSIAHFKPELGESIATAQQKNVNRMAVQIVSMMEKAW